MSQAADDLTQQTCIAIVTRSFLINAHQQRSTPKKVMVVNTKKLMHDHT